MSQRRSFSAMNYALIGLALLGLLLIWLTLLGVFGRQHVSAQTFVDFQQGDEPHLGFRRAHAKGVCVAGEFVSSGALADYSIAELLQQGVTPMLGRFSIGGGNPTAPDLTSPVRSFAFSLDAGANQQWRSAMNTPPVMAVATPDAFFAQLNALAPNPHTGERDGEKIAAFFATHPETQAFRQWSASYQPSASFAQETFHSINAFYLVNADGKQQAVRWHLKANTEAMPGIEQPSSVADNPYAQSERANDALGLEIADRIRERPVVFDLVFTFADPSDDASDPTVAWPSSRRHVVAGQIVIERVVDSPSVCDAVNFDPLILPTGMRPSEDAILRARSAAYAESYRRRAREQIFHHSDTTP